jgi:transposase
VKRTRCTPTAEQLATLAKWASERATQPQLARRAQVILLSAQGVSGVGIASRLRLSNGQVSRIRARFLAEGVAGLRERARRGRTDHAVPEALVLTVLALATSTPPAGQRRWSTRLLAARVGLTSATVSKILRTRARASPPRRPLVGNVSVRE